MADYRRADVAGGTYFFTVVTERRAPVFASPAARHLLRTCVQDGRAKRPFDIVAAVVLPDHSHMIWTLPPGDADFAARWALIKATFSKAYAGPEQSITPSRLSRGHRGIWQKRYWEHLIRDDVDLVRHVDYIHYNPVKHGHATCPHAWEATSFHRFVRDGVYANDWSCQCDRPATVPDFEWANGLE